MTSIMKGLTFTEKGIVYDRHADNLAVKGDLHAFRAARTSAMTMRMLAVDEGEMTPEAADEANQKAYPDPDPRWDPRGLLESTG